MRQFGYDDLSDEDKRVVDAEARRALLKVFTVFLELVILPDAASTIGSGVTGCELRRKAGRLRESAAGGEVADHTQSLEAAALERSAVGHRLLAEARAEVRAMKEMNDKLQKKYEARERQREIEERQAARAAGQLDVVRELNRAHHRERGRVRKRKESGKRAGAGSDR
jgi:hypothetical protein